MSYRRTCHFQIPWTISQ